MVLAHAQALRATAPGVIALPGDLRDPEAIMADLEPRQGSFLAGVGRKRP